MQARATVLTDSTRGEIPLNFKAAKNGSYTISVNVGNVDLNYLHLVDNLTGNDVELMDNGTGKDVLPGFTMLAMTQSNRLHSGRQTYLEIRPSEAAPTIKVNSPGS